MQNRNLSFEAVVLRARESPGGDRIVTLLAADAGLVDAFVFGGPKSRLRSLASPYHAGIAWVYRDPVKDFQKLSDFDARGTYPTLRENLRKLWAASFLAETVLRTDAAGGESRAIYNLLREGLYSLDSTEESYVDYICIQYSWRLLDLMGLQPDMESCVRCGAPRRDTEGAPFSRALGGLVCPSCARQDGPAEAMGLVPLSGGTLRYLNRTRALPFQGSIRVGVSGEDLAPLKTVSFHLIQGAAEGGLRTLSHGELL